MTPVLNAFDYLESGVVVYGPDDRMVFCNRRFREIYAEISSILVPGVAYADIARTFYRQRHDLNLPQTEDEYVAERVALHRNPPAVDLEYVMKDGTHLLLSDRRTPEGYIIGLRQDITARKRAEAQLAEVERQANRELEAKVAERTRDLQESNRRLESTLADLRNAQSQLVQSEKLASLGHLVAGIAHEINTPIGNALLLGSAMEGRSSAFQRSAQDKLTRRELQSYTAEILDGCGLLISNLQRAASLVKGFKQLAVDRATEQRRRFNLLETVSNVVLSMGPLLKKVPYSLSVDIPEDLELDSFPGPLSQIVVNFINNALLHAFEERDAGSMRLQARVTPGNTLELVFSDDGRGMPEVVSKRVFDPFFTTKLGQGGSGLGMHIAYNLTTQVLGGSITVHSAPGHGTVWTLKIPCIAP